MPKPDKELLKAKRMQRRGSSVTIPSGVRGFVPVHFEPVTEKIVERPPIYTTDLNNNSESGEVRLEDLNEETEKNDGGLQLVPYVARSMSSEFDSETISDVFSTDDATQDPFECLDSEMIAMFPSDSSISTTIDFSEEAADSWTKLPNSLLDHSLDYNEILIIACANGFIKSINTQYTHPLLTTSATFTPLIRRNNLIEQVALSCGATYLSWNNPGWKSFAYEKFTKSFGNLSNFLNSGDFDLERDEAWLGAAFQLMCLCSKIMSMSNGNKPLSVKALNNSYKLIRLKARFRRSTLEKNEATEIDDGSSDFFENLTHDDLKMDIENDLVQLKQPQVSTKVSLSNQYDKMFLDSFIYNYSISLLFVQDRNDLPNPFSVFNDMRSLLKTPLFSCDVAWMNNPVFGASLNSFELAAKAAFLMRRLENPSTLPIAQTLYDIAKYLPQPIIPIKVRCNSVKYQNLRESVLISECVVSATKILLKKIIDVDIKESEPVIQREVEGILQRMEKVRESSQCKPVSSWALFICGLACTENNRSNIIRHFRSIGEILHGHNIFSILEALEIAWGTHPKKDKFHHLRGKGLDVLLNADFLSTIVV
jgi:hypothetical protein